MRPKSYDVTKSGSRSSLSMTSSCPVIELLPDHKLLGLNRHKNALTKREFWKNSHKLVNSWRYFGNISNVSNEQFENGIYESKWIDEAWFYWLNFIFNQDKPHLFGKTAQITPIYKFICHWMAIKYVSLVNSYYITYSIQVNFIWEFTCHWIHRIQFK